MEFDILVAADAVDVHFSGEHPHVQVRGFGNLNGQLEIVVRAAGDPDSSLFSGDLNADLDVVIPPLWV